MHDVSSEDSQTEPPPRHLAVLRAMIDVVDREMLGLLARRNALIGEVAAFKRARGVPIRDHDREREIIRDRRERSVPLGLRPDVIESAFRLMLAASRDRQAELKAQVPLDVEPKTVGIIGGEGAMGQCMARLFSDLGHAVMVADVDTELRAEDLASVADVVLVSVPIDMTIDVIRQIGPCVREDALLMDITSTKTGPMRTMLESSGASVIGTHPLFGPNVHTLQGQRIVLTHGRGDNWLAWLRQMLGARGLVIHESTPEQHDEAMSIVQVLTHFSTEVMGKAMASLGTPLEATLPFTSPVYLMELLMTARHFAQSPDLYASIELSNPQMERVTRAFAKAASEMRDILDRGDRKAFTEVFEAVRAHFGSFSDEALERSSYLIDRMIERS